MGILSLIRRWLKPKRARQQLMPRQKAVIRGMPPAVGEPRPLPSAAPAPPSADMVRSAIRKGFNASQPVTSVRHLHGRRQQMEQLVEGVLDRCNHALIYGPRGSGKTSIARVFANIADDRGFVVLYSACEPDQSLHQLITPYITALEGEGAEEPPAPLTVREMVDRLALQARGKYIFILDEFDRVTDMAVQHELARLMKMLSDAAIPVQIVAAGIASSLDSMIEGHASLRRHLTPVAVTSIESGAVFDLIAKGAATTGLAFTDASREMIAHLSCGSPYHVRLFCALACYEALRRQERTVDMSATLAGIARAVNDWSLTNAEDAALFRKVIAIGPACWDGVEMVAREAAANGAISVPSMQRESPSGHEALGLLRGGLVPFGGAADQLAFRDSLAPQFLLAMLFATRNSDNIDENIVSFVDPHRHQIAY